jgi:uncharacterized protein YfaQ (DUF2300 family)
MNAPSSTWAGFGLYRRAALHLFGGVLALICAHPVFAHIGVGPAQCTALPEAQAWLDRHSATWDPILASEPGYQRPAHVTVCQLNASLPFADNRAGRVYVRGLSDTNSQITLAHEYLHIAFQHYPSGHDERYVESTARRLIATYP